MAGVGIPLCRLQLDIAVDPLEGTNFAANNLPGALSVIAIAEKDNLFKAPETYMEKISTKVKEKNVVDLDYSVKKNIFNLSEYLNKKPDNLTACILERPRHNKIINELRDLVDQIVGAMINFALLQSAFNTIVGVNIWHPHYAGSGAPLNNQILSAVNRPLKVIRDQLNSSFPNNYLTENAYKKISSSKVITT